MRNTVLLIAIPGLAWSFVTCPAITRSRPVLVNQEDGSAPCPSSSLLSARPVRRKGPKHALRCRPLWKKKGGLAKQAELLALMAKLEQESAQKELEDKLKENGDLESEGTEEKARLVGSIVKPDKGWRQAGGGGGGSSVAQALPAPEEDVEEFFNGKRKKKGARAVGTAQRENNEEFEKFPDLVGAGDQFVPDVNTGYREYDALLEKVKRDNTASGNVKGTKSSSKESNRAYTDFDEMLSSGVEATYVAPAVEEARDQRHFEVGLLQRGDFANLDIWSVLTDTSETKMDFGLFRGTKPLLVVADPNKDSADIKVAMEELNMRMPRKMADVVAITADTPSFNRKVVKKRRILFPVLSDPDRDWMEAYRVTADGIKDKMVFLIDPELGTIIKVYDKIDSLSLVDTIKDDLNRGT